MSPHRMGRQAKLPKGYATLPLSLDYPVRTMDDWLRLQSPLSVL